MKYVYSATCIVLILIVENVSAQWSNCSSPNFRHFNSVSVIDNQNIVAAGGNRTNDEIQSVITTANGGNTWNITRDELRPWLKSVTFLNAGLGYAVGYRGTIIRSNDAGANWDTLPTPPNVSSRDFNSVFFLNDSVGFIAGGHQSNDSIQGDDSMQTILKTVNGGASWSVQRDVAGFWLTSVFFTDANNGFAVGEHGTILKTSNGGGNWTPVTLTGNMANRNYNSVCFINSTTGFAVGGYPANDSIRTILKTTDGGNIWGIVMDNLGPMLNAVDFSTAITGYAVGNFGTAYSSGDAGDNWTPINNLPSGGVLDTMDLKGVDFLNADFGMVVGRYGKLLKYVSSVVSVPVVTTLSANKVGSTTAQLNMLANASGYSTSRSFEYGTTLAFGNTVQLPGSITGNTTQADSVMLTGLLPNTFYYYRASATNQNGIVHGNVKQFYTSDCEIPNCDFEIWDTIFIDKPTYWNMQGLHKATSYNGSSAAQLGPNEGTMGLVNLHSDILAGGIPFAARPDSLVFYAQYDLAPGDSAFVLIFFKLNGTIFNQNVFTIAGNSGGNFERLSFPVQFSNGTVPDSLMIAFTTSRPFDHLPANPSNTITIDEVHFIGTNIVLPNWNFEQWDTIIEGRPANWYSNSYIKEGTSHLIEKVTDYITGHYALELSTRAEASTSIMVGDTEIWYNPSFPVAGKHLTLNFFLKFQPVGNDSLWLSVSMFNQGNYIGYATMVIDTPVPDYTPVSLDITYNPPNVIPDSANIVILVGSQNSPGNSHAFFDNFSFDGFRNPTWIKKTLEPRFNFALYPNPASTSISVLFDEPGNYRLQLFDFTGRLVQSESLSGRANTVNIAGLSGGIYLAKFITPGKTYDHKLLILR